MRNFYLYTAILTSLFFAGFVLAAKTELFNFTPSAHVDSSKPSAAIEEENSAAFDDCSHISISVTVESHQKQCKNPQGGQLSANITPSNGNYTIEWFPVSDIGDLDARVSVGKKTDNKLEAGLYAVKVTDNANGCYVMEYEEVKDESPSMKYRTEIENQVIGCSGDELGSLKLIMEDDDNVLNMKSQWYREDGSEITPYKNSLFADDLEVGTYKVTVRNESSGCIGDPYFITIGKLTPPAIGGTATDNTMCNDGTIGNGKISLELTTEGPAPTNGFDLSWSGPVSGSTSGVTSLYDITDLPAGTYTVVASDPADADCTSSEEFTIADDLIIPAISLESTETTVCVTNTTNGGYDGTITTTLTYDGAPVSDFGDFTFNLFDVDGNELSGDNSTSANVFEKLEGGNYQLSVTNTLTNCTSGLAPINVPEQQPDYSLVLTPTAQTNCADDPNGGLEVEVSKDGNVVTSGYTLTWFKGGTTDGDEITANIAGNKASLLEGGMDYTVEVTDTETGCSAVETDFVALDQPELAIQVTSQPNTLCAGGSFDGSITAVLTVDGTEVSDHTGYTFHWKSPDNSEQSTSANTLSGLEQGDYEVWVVNTESECKSEPEPIEVEFIPEELTLELDPTPRTTCVAGTPNGEVKVVILKAGTEVTDYANYSYEWYIGVDAATGNSFSPGMTNNTATGLDGEKDYTVVVTDANSGCTVEEMTYVGLDETLPVLTETLTDNIGCEAGKYTGKIELEVKEGVDGDPVTDFSAYSFTWLNETSGSTVTNQSNIHSDLEEGPYKITVKNTVTGCEVEKRVLVLEDKPEFVLDLQATDQTNCEGGDNGEILVNFTKDLTAVTDFSGYTINLYTGSSVSGTPLSTLASGDNEATGLAKGQYTIEVIHDETGCSGSKAIIVDEVLVKPIISATSNPNINCDASLTPTGDITVTVTNAAAGDSYTYEWKQYDGTAIAVSDASSNILDELEDGQYRVIAKNASTGCASAEKVVEVEANKVKPALTVSTEDNTVCAGSFDGIVKVMVGGADDPAGYSYEWFEGSPSTGTLLSYNTYETTVLEGGGYSIRVTHDATGCQSVAYATVENDITDPEVSVAVTDNISCIQDGKLTATVINSGSTANYSFIWYRGQSDDPAQEISGETAAELTEYNGASLPAAEYYTVVLKNDDTQCLSEPKTVYLDPPPAAFTIDFVNVDQPASCNLYGGVVTAYVSGDPDLTDKNSSSKYRFTWYEGTPTDPDASFYTDPAVAFEPGTQITDLDPDNDASNLTINGFDQNVDYFAPNTAPNEGQSIFKRGTGVYTVVVENINTNCKEWRQVTIPYNAQHQGSIDVEHVTDCNAASTGSFIAEILDENDDPEANQSGFDIHIFEGTNAGDFNADEVPGTPVSGGQDLGGTTTTISGLAPGWYTIVAVDKTDINQCKSIEVTKQIQIITAPPEVSVKNKSSNESCDTPDGAFTIEFGPGEFAPNETDLETVKFNVYISDPDDTNPSNQLGSGELDAGEITASNLAEGVYTIKVEGLKLNTDGTYSLTCEKIIETTLGKNKPLPVLTGSTTDQDECSPPNGSARIDEITFDNNTYVSDPLAPLNFSDFTFNWYASEQDYIDGTKMQDSNGVIITDSETDANLGAGTYYVTAQRTSGLSAGCSSAPATLTIDNISTLPIISFESDPNADCSAPSGTLTATVTTKNLIGGPYNFEWFFGQSTDPADAFPGTSSGTIEIVGTDGNIQKLNGIEAGEYALKLTEGNCTPVIQYFEVESTISEPVIAAWGTPVPNTNCPDGTVVHNGSFEITTISYNGSDFTNSTAEPDKIDDNFHLTGYTEDPTINPSATTFPASSSMNGLSPGTYYLVTSKKHKPGKGCGSLPFEFTIEDKPVSRFLSLESTQNDACDPDEANGTIKATLLEDGTAPAPADYEISWFKVDNAAGDNPVDLVTAVSNADISTNELDVTRLPAGFYQAEAKLASGCLVSEIYEVKQKSSTFNLRFASSPNTTCDAPYDGSFTVTRVTYNGTTYEGSTGATAINGNFSFVYYESLADYNDPGISGLPLTDAVRKISLNEGTYLVVATNEMPYPEPGAGCVSTPFPVTVSNAPVEPVLRFSSNPNDACDPNQPNGTMTATLTVAGNEPSATLYPTATRMTWTRVSDGFDVSATASPSPSVIGVETAVALLPGIYEVITTLANGCSVTGTHTVEEIILPISLTVEATTQTSCNHGGTVEVEGVKLNGVTADRGDFTYSWFIQEEDGSLAPIAGLDPEDYMISTSNYPNIEAGKYYVTAHKTAGNAAGCESDPFSATIQSNPFYPGLSLSGISNDACFDSEANGSITATVDAGNSAQIDEVLWYFVADDGTETLVSSAVGTATFSANELEVSGLPAGTYKAQVTLDNGCPVSATYKLGKHITDFELSADTAPQIGCENGGEISITGILTNGTPADLASDYTYNWYKREANGDLTAIHTNSNITTLNLDNYSAIEAGTYHVEAVKTANPAAGCGPAMDIEIPFTETQPEIIVNHLTPLSGCNPDSRGMIDISVNSPVNNDLEVTWYTSAQHDESRDSWRVYQLNQTVYSGDVIRIDALTGAYYYAEVYDPLSKCSILYEFLIEEEVIEANISASAQDLWKCSPENGEIYLYLVNRERFTYAYPESIINVTISKAEDEDYERLEELDLSQSHQLHLVDLGVGTYYISYQESGQNQCAIAGDTLVIEDISMRYDPLITQTAPYTVCDTDLANGALSATVEGSTEDYTFAWYEGEVDESTTADPVSTSAEATGLRDITYTVIATSELTGCTTLAQFSIEEESAPFRPLIEQDVMLTVCDPALANAELSATVGGNISEYTFAWYLGEVAAGSSAEPISRGYIATGLGDTTYTVIATHTATGCEGVASHRIEVDFPVIPTDSSWIVSHPTTSCQVANGSLEIGVESIYNNYIINWYRGADAHPDSLIDSGVQSIEGLEAGTYSITLSSLENGCTSTSFTRDVEEDYYFPKYKINIKPSTCIEEGSMELVDKEGKIPHYEWYDENRQDMLAQNGPYHGPSGHFWIKIVSDMDCIKWVPVEIDEVVEPYNAMSLNGDGQNEYFHIGCIEMFPENRVRIYNRAGTLVYETRRYDNKLNSFLGRGNRGIYVNGRDLPVGTYYYVLDKGFKNEKPQTGFLELLR